MKLAENLVYSTLCPGKQPTTVNIDCIDIFLYPSSKTWPDYLIWIQGHGRTIYPEERELSLEVPVSPDLTDQDILSYFALQLQAGACSFCCAKNGLYVCEDTGEHLSFKPSMSV